MSNELVIKPDAARLCVLERPTFINERLATFLSAANAKGLAGSRLQIGQATLLLAVFGELAGRNRPQGASVNLRFQHPF